MKKWYLFYIALCTILGLLPALDSFLARRGDVASAIMTLLVYGLGLGTALGLGAQVLNRWASRSGSDWRLLVLAIVMGFALILTTGSLLRPFGVYFAGRCGQWLFWSKLSVIGCCVLGSLIALGCLVHQHYSRATSEVSYRRSKTFLTKNL